MAKALKNIQTCERKALGRSRVRGSVEDMVVVDSKCGKQLRSANKLFHAFDKAAARAGQVCEEYKTTSKLYDELKKTNKKLGVK